MGVVGLEWVAMMGCGTKRLKTTGQDSKIWSYFQLMCGIGSGHKLQTPVTQQLSTSQPRNMDILLPQVKCRKFCSATR